MLKGTLVVVAGGSMAGCAAAVALERAGCEVSVFERSTHLQDRGSGIATPIALRDELIEAGYLSGDYETCKFAHRRWVIEDGTPHGGLLWTQRSEAATNNWGSLWRSLRHQVPDEIYRSGVSVTSIVEAADQVTITTSDGETVSFDALIGADGYRSHVPAMLVPEQARCSRCNSHHYKCLGQ